MKRTAKGVIYKAKRGHIYDSGKPKFNCYAAAHTGNFEIVDCWVCDQNGNMHPGYNVSPVPVNTSNLGETVGNLYGDNED